MARRWSEDEDALLLKLRTEGLTSREITSHLKERSYAAVRARLSSLAPDNLNRPWTDEDIKILFTMKEEGRSTKYIAKRLDRTASAVSSYYTRHSSAYYSLG